MPTDVRDAAEADGTAIATMLTRAFDDDPVFTWMIPDPAVRACRLPPLFAGFFADDGPPGLRLTTPGCEAATLWRAPGTAAGEPLSLWHAWRLLGGALLRGKRVGEAIEARFPRHPFWYLHIAGCDPAEQGRGHGRAVVQAGLNRIGNMPVYLETAKERNLPFISALVFKLRTNGAFPAADRASGR